MLDGNLFEFANQFYRNRIEREKKNGLFTTPFSNNIFKVLEVCFNCKDIENVVKNTKKKNKSKE